MCSRSSVMGESTAAPTWRIQSWTPWPSATVSRPGNSRASVASSMAASAGLRNGTGSSPIPTATRSDHASAAAAVVSPPSRKQSSHSHSSSTPDASAASTAARSCSGGDWGGTPHRSSCADCARRRGHQPYLRGRRPPGSHYGPPAGRCQRNAGPGHPRVVSPGGSGPAFLLAFANAYLRAEDVEPPGEGARRSRADLCSRPSCGDTESAGASSLRAVARRPVRPLPDPHRDGAASTTSCP